MKRKNICSLALTLLMLLSCLCAAYADTGWSWRYDATYDPDKPDGCTFTAGHNSGSITCTNTLKNDRWLNGFSDVIANIFGIRH